MFVPKLTEGERIALIAAVGVIAAAVVPAAIHAVADAIKSRREPPKSEEKDAT